MIKVLCIADYFLPGFKGGGPITSINNMRKLLKGSVEFYIFTRDRDLGSPNKYQNVKTNTWISDEYGPVFYADPENFGARGVAKILTKIDFDMIYLNSFFSPQGSIKPFLYIKSKSTNTKTIIAPRGEFSKGALSIKPAKKYAYLKFAQVTNLYRDAHWHASTDAERDDIIKALKSRSLKISVAADPIFSDTIIPATFKTKEPGSLKAVFISRISPMKNLHGLLDILEKLPSHIKVHLDIFGPIEDNEYWHKCLDKINKLHSHTQANYFYPISPHEVAKTFSKYDVFIFPTLGENFGHVIFEALGAGTPVITSDRTPWTPDEHGSLKVINLDDVTQWIKAIETAALRSESEQAKLRFFAIEYTKFNFNYEKIKNDNLKIFTCSKF